MPVPHQKGRRLFNMEDGPKEEENTDEHCKARRNIFGTTLTDEDRERLEAELKELNEESKRKLMNYEILGIEKTLDKPEKPEPRTSIVKEDREEPENSQDDK